LRIRTYITYAITVSMIEIDNEIQKLKPYLMSNGNEIRKTKLGTTAIRTFHESDETLFMSLVSR